MCEQPHQVITVGDTFLSRFAYYAERSVYLTDGCVDLTRAPDLYISETAREIAPVKVVGTFGSEILRHLAMFKPVRLAPGVFRPELLTYVKQSADTYHQARREHPVTFAVFRQFPWYHYGVFALEQSQLTVRSPYLDNDFVRTVFRAPELTADSGDVRLRLISDGSPALGRLRSDRGAGGSSDPLSVAASRALLEFTFKAEYAYDYGMPQWLAKIDHLFSSLHPECAFLGRHKVFHFRVWYRDALSKYVREILLDPRTLARPYVERKGVEAIVQGHLEGKRNFTVEIHKLLTLELLHRLFLDS
jgi:asparagine synthase (glutamine-hydrolysing)